MRSTTFLTRFAADEAGAVTVDWVVLTAALVGLGMATMGVVSGGVSDLSGDVDGQLTSQEITTEFAAAAGPFERNLWDAHNPGAVAANEAWMANFGDEQLLNHMNNMAQFADIPANSGHPLDTYHDEYWIARDEAITRGLVDPNA